MTKRVSVSLDKTRQRFVEKTKRSFVFYTTPRVLKKCVRIFLKSFATTRARGLQNTDPHPNGVGGSCPRGGVKIFGTPPFLGG